MGAILNLLRLRNGQTTILVSCFILPLVTYNIFQLNVLLPYAGNLIRTDRPDQHVAVHDAAARTWGNATNTVMRRTSAGHEPGTYPPDHHAAVRHAAMRRNATLPTSAPFTHDDPAHRRTTVQIPATGPNVTQLTSAQTNPPGHRTAGYDAATRRNTTPPTSAEHGLETNPPARTHNPHKARNTTRFQVKATDNVPVLGIVTAFSKNHLLEAVNCLRTLIQVGFKGPLSIYFLKTERDGPLGEEFDSFRRQVAQTPLNATILEHIVSSHYLTYCFKPEVVEHHLMHGPRSKVLMWMDSSTRFVSHIIVAENPELGAQRMLDAGTTFTGRVAPFLGMAENTHELTWKYLGKSRFDFKDRHEIVATHFLINLTHEGVIRHVLEPWLDCGVRHCGECMSPPGSSKHIQQKVKGPPSTDIITHRQDQSVLGILVYDWMLRLEGKVELGRVRRASESLRADIRRHHLAPSVNLVETQPTQPTIAVK